MKHALFCLALSMCIGIMGGARADTIAASLYDEGIALLKEKKFEAACDKLDASFKREPLSGTLMTLAQCHQLRGMSATAWDEYTRAAGLARAEGREEYEVKAKELAQKLEPSLSRLEIDLAAQDATDLKVAISGEPVSAATFGVALALDPGEYTVTAAAEGFTSWSKTVMVNQPGKTVTIMIPTLERAAPAPHVVPPTPTPQPVAPIPGPAPQPDQMDDDGGVPAWAWVVGGIGIASAAVSLAFLGVNRGVASDLDSQCGGEARDDCPARDVYDAEGDHDAEKLSSGLFIGFGGAAIAGIAVGLVGIIIGTSSGSSESQGSFAPIVSPEGGALMYTRRF